MLVVGVSHLRPGLPEAALGTVLARLRSFAPSLICIEALEGALVQQYQAIGGGYADFRFGGAPIARAALQALSGHPINDHPAHTALASGNPHRALLSDWRSADLPAAALELLQALQDDVSERVRVGVRLAREFGHDTLAQVDEHPGLEPADHLPADWREHRMSYVRAMQATAPDAPTRPDGDDQWALIRWFASAPVIAWLERIQGLTGQPTDDPSGVLASRQSQWLGRNLAMAGRIATACATRPSGRVLVLVGASHVPLLTAALRLHPGRLQVLTAADLPD